MSSPFGYEAKLWAPADLLPNNMDTAECRHAELIGQFDQAANPEDTDDSCATNIYWVSQGAHWSWLKDNASQSIIGELVNVTLPAIERPNGGNLLKPIPLSIILGFNAMPSSDYKVQSSAASRTSTSPDLDPDGDGGGPTQRIPVSIPFHSEVQVAGNPTDTGCVVDRCHCLSFLFGSEGMSLFWGHRIQSGHIDRLSRNLRTVEEGPEFLFTPSH